MTGISDASGFSHARPTSVKDAQITHALLENYGNIDNLGTFFQHMIAGTPYAQEKKDHAEKLDTLLQVLHTKYNAVTVPNDHTLMITGKNNKIVGSVLKEGDKITFVQPSADGTSKPVRPASFAKMLRHNLNLYNKQSSTPTT